MEGSNNRNLKAYDYLAYYYDILLGDKEAFDLWLKEIETEDFKTVLELASGSGVMASILKDKGYDVVASDISASMKKAAESNYNGEYLLLNMADYNLNKKFDLILCICDSINYLNESELISFFNCAYNHLNDNGRLIFDMHSIKRIEEFKDEYIEEGDLNDIKYQWTIMSDPYSNTINEHFTFYTADGMIQEQHIQQVFDVDDVISKMESVGFKTRLKEDFVKDEKVLMVARK